MGKTYRTEKKQHRNFDGGIKQAEHAHEKTKNKRELRHILDDSEEDFNQSNDDGEVFREFYSENYQE